MSNYIVTVIKTGNSYALRVPKRYVEDAQLKLGQKAAIELPSSPLRQDRTRIQEVVRRLQASTAYREIDDPVAWQRRVRADRRLPGRD